MVYLASSLKPYLETLGFRTQYQVIIEKKSVCPNRCE